MMLPILGKPNFQRFLKKKSYYFRDNVDQMEL